MSIKPSKSVRDNLLQLLRMSKEQDLGSGDVTSSVLQGDTQASGVFLAVEPIVFCGGVFLDEIAAIYDGQIRTEVLVEESARVKKGDILAKWHGPARGILAAERVALNFLQRLSGVATATAEYVDAAAGTCARIYDTRKTTPGWRELEKYAVRVGGGQNHRKGLYDAVLIKDNHLAILAREKGEDPIKALEKALPNLRAYLCNQGFIEIEVDTLEQLQVALSLPVDIILLDNMTDEQLCQAVQARDAAGLKGSVELEASGGITLKNVREVAGSGVERIAIGAITHSARAVDISLEIEIN